MQQSLKVFDMVFIAHHQAAKVEKPGKEPLDFPATFIAAHRPSVLRRANAILLVGSDHFDAVAVHQPLIQPVAVISFVPNQSFRHIGHSPFLQRGLHESHFSRRSAFCPQGERKTIAVRNAHNFGSFASLGLPDAEPPFLAGTKVPSTKHSLRSKPPASLRCPARVKSRFSMTPERTHCWNRRWAVWCGPYRGGKSCQRAPVRRIHNTPSNTMRRSLQGRPRPSSRTGSWGRMSSTIFHCSFVKSIHNYYTVLGKVQETFCPT